MASKCDLLADICLSNCPLVTDKGVVALLRGCPDIHTLRLAWCVAVSDVSLHALANAQCKLRIRHLDISHCRRVTDAGLAEVTLRCQKLEELNISCCRNLTFQSLVTVCGVMKRAGLLVRCVFRAGFCWMENLCRLPGWVYSPP